MTGSVGDQRVSGIAYFEWYAGSLHALISKGEGQPNQETNEPLSFLSSNHGVKLSSLCQLGQVDALRQQCVKEWVRKYSEKLP
jgi:hypothetical protein